MELKGKQWNIDARPYKMSDVYGGSSSSIDTMLKPFVKNHIKDDKWPRGILLMGKPGGGKTTIAKILAMIMTCKHLDKEGNPCGECPDCKAIINEKWNRDVTLVNATELKNEDQTSVEGMVRLVQKSKTSPFFGSKRNVIIIDEIQELLRGNMKASINTLLKELENPNSKTCWIFTSMDEIKAEGNSNSGYGSSGLSGFLRRVTTFKFGSLSKTDILKYLFNFSQNNTYEGTKLWDFILSKGGKEFVTNGLLAIAESSNGSLGAALKNFQQCIESEIYEPSKIGLAFRFTPESTIQSLMSSLAKNEKDENAFIQLTSIDSNTMNSVYNILVSELRKAEQLRVFGKIGNLKYKDGKPEVVTIDAKSQYGDAGIYNRSENLLKSKNYQKIKETILKLGQIVITPDILRNALLNIYS